MRPERRKSRFAVLLVDVINHMRFSGGRQLAREAATTVKPINTLRRAAAFR